MQHSRENSRLSRRGRSLWKEVGIDDQRSISIPVHLAYCGIASALRHHATVKSSGLALLAVESPDAIDTYVDAGRLFLRQALGRKGYLEPYVRAYRRNNADKRTELELFARASENGKGIIFCTGLDELDEDIRLFADVAATIPKPTPNQLRAVFKAQGHLLTAAEENLVSSETWTRLVLAFQPDRPPENALRRLRGAASRKPASDERQEPKFIGPSLADLTGLGPIKDWGVDLATDFADFRAGRIRWDDIDAGALVSGPPGTGKTLFAEALARTCEVPIVVASAARWQAAGYLNDMLTAMRDSFREAQSKGVALLFIDEIDSIGSRAISDSRNADYKRQVINALLELLDGFERRQGIVVIGATNHPENIDPAIIRPGRLGRQFRIPLPDAVTRRQIFGFHAGIPIPDMDEAQFYRSTEGMSGADLRQLVRDGRRRARRKGEDFSYGHVAAVAQPLIRLPVKHMRIAAVHEAGHAIVGIVIGMKLQSVTITDTVRSEGVDTLGGAEFIPDRFPMKTKSYYLDLICMYLGGLAAEMLIFGEFGDAVAGDPSSDLGMATNLATRIEACFGMGHTLAIEIAPEREFARLRSGDYRLRSAIGELLDAQFTRVNELLDRHRNALVAIAEKLTETMAMSASEVEELLSRHPATGDPLRADTADPNFARPVANRAVHQPHEREVRKEIDAALRRWGML